MENNPKKKAPLPTPNPAPAASPGQPDGVRSKWDRPSYRPPVEVEKMQEHLQRVADTATALLSELQEVKEAGIEALRLPCSGNRLRFEQLRFDIGQIAAAVRKTIKKAQVQQ